MWKGQLKQGSTKLKSHRQARAWVDQYKVNLANGDQGLAPAPTVEMAFRKWFATYRGKFSDAHMNRAESAFRIHIIPLCGDITCDQISEDVVEAIRTRYLETPSSRKFGSQTHSLTGCNTIIRYLKNVLTYAMKKCPFKVRRLRPADVRRPYVPKELVPPFLQEIDRTNNKHLSIAVRAMLYMGLRESEALNMRWDWFSPNLKTYTPGKTKGKEAWDLPVHPELISLLEALPNRIGLVLPWVDEKGNVNTHRPAFSKKGILRAGNKIEVHGLSPHSLRRTAATLMDQAGIGAKTIQRQMRHKDFATTAGYIQSGLKDLEEAQQKVWGAS